MHRFSLRAKTAARRECLDVVAQVLWLTLDYHGAEGRAVAVYLSRKSTREFHKGAVGLTFLQGTSNNPGISILNDTIRDLCVEDLRNSLLLRAISALI